MSEPIRYTRERLLEAAARCRDIDEVIAFFGTRPYGQLRGYLWRRFAYHGIDASHLRRSGYRKRGSRPSAEELRDAVARSVSLAGVLRVLGRPDNTHQRATLKRWIAEDGLATGHFLGVAHRRGGPGTTPRLGAGSVLVKHEGRRRTRSSHLRRALAELGVPERCAHCGTGPVWHGRPMNLEVDHINGDWSDDRADNLRLLCPNCHAITSTWCRGGGRRTAR
ncbi:HNH endonuclease signature motif containing protein [Streptomyces sp. NPDC047434]|uniref:HNH endonuclease signature motif containing protein n=1 Tax=Streptomyces sp. NPDC047434 TaxID=3155143 RepID=UPI0033CC2CF9